MKGINFMIKLILLIGAILNLTACHRRVTGPMGPKGADGSSCSVNQTLTGAIISCTDGTTAVLLNGQDGVDGSPAPTTPYSITEVIDLCGTQPGFNEVLLRTHNNKLISHFSSGSNQFLALIGPGNYISTDGKNCYFTVHPDMSVTW